MSEDATVKIHHVAEPLDAEDADLAESRFRRVKLENCIFTDVDLRRAQFSDVSLRGARFTDVDLRDCAIDKANLAGMTINGVQVTELLRVYRAAGMDRAEGVDDGAGLLAVTEIKAFVPARDFSVSKQFYRDIGFTMKSEGGGVAYFCAGEASFLLQDFYDAAAAANFMMHLLVRDVDAWWANVERSRVVETYGVKVWPIELQPWRMRDFCLADPSGVLWRIGQNVP